MAEPDTGVEVLSSTVRRDIVDMLANLPREVSSDGVVRTSLPGLSAAQVAERMGLHVTTARFHLDLLVRAGLVRTEIRKSGGAGRPRKIYSASGGSLHHVPDSTAYRALAELLAQAFLPAADGRPVSPEEAGRRWVKTRHPREDTPGRSTSMGEWFGKIGHTIDRLRGWGYEPDIRTEDGGHTAYLTLVDCPFIDLAKTNPDVVCGVHRGLLIGTMESLGEPDASVGLQPFVSPNRCLARLSLGNDLNRHSANQEKETPHE
ncbi:MAG: helix-turn-helix domain-containing protein [Micrococcales bacterium]|nr:helix-turn-helix domain-containing protein [Micrococcales bacterium]